MAKIDLNAVMLAGIKNDNDGMRTAIPGLVAYIRELEENLRLLHIEYEQLQEDILDIAKEYEEKSVTERVMDAFPGSKLTGSTKK